MRITNHVTNSEIIDIGKEEFTMRFYYGDAHVDRKYKHKNEKVSLLTILKVFIDCFRTI